MDCGPPYHPSGEITASLGEARIGCLAVAGVDSDSWRRPCHIRHWNVIEKIRPGYFRGDCLRPPQIPGNDSTRDLY